MKMKTIGRNLADMQTRLSQDCYRLLKGPEDRIRTLVFAVKEVKIYDWILSHFFLTVIHLFYGGKGQVILLHL